MDFVQITAFALVALLLVVSPGPNGLLIAKTVPISGKSAGFANVAGFLTAFYAHGLLSILGISIILTKSAEAFLVVKVLGALYLTWIGVKALISAFKNTPIAQPVSPTKSKKTLIKAYIEGFLTNALNPKVSMFYLAAFPQFIPSGEHALLYGFILISVHALMNMLWFSGMVILFSRLTIVSKKYIFQKILKGTTGLIFIGFGAKLVTLQAE